MNSLRILQTDSDLAQFSGTSSSNFALLKGADFAVLKRVDGTTISNSSSFSPQQISPLKKTKFLAVPSPHKKNKKKKTSPERITYGVSN